MLEREPATIIRMETTDRTLAPEQTSPTLSRSGLELPGLRQTAQQICAGQHGVLSRRQLLEAGIPGSTIDSRLRKFLFPVFCGVYAVGRPQVSREALWMAGVFAGGNGAALGGASAAAAWGFMKVRPAVEVVRLGRARTERSPIHLNDEIQSIPLRIRNTRSLPDRDVRTIGPIAIVSPARALLDLAASLTPSAWSHAFLEADRLGLLDDGELADCVERGRGHPGAGLLRSRLADRIPDLDRAKSLLEGLMLEACRRDGVEPPEVNSVIGRHEVDCVWHARGLAVELDSYGFHRGQEKFEIDLRRNNRLLAEGWILLRFTWRRVTREPEQVINEVRAALNGGLPSRADRVPHFSTK